MKTVRFYALMMILILNCGCSALVNEPTRVMLKHPDTLDYVTCKVDDWATPESYAKNDKCVEGYQKKGYVIWGER